MNVVFRDGTLDGMVGPKRFFYHALPSHGGTNLTHPCSFICLCTRGRAYFEQPAANAVPSIGVVYQPASLNFT